MTRVEFPAPKTLNLFSNQKLTKPASFPPLFAYTKLIHLVGFSWLERRDVLWASEAAHGLVSPYLRGTPGRG